MMAGMRGTVQAQLLSYWVKIYFKGQYEGEAALTMML